MKKQESSVALMKRRLAKTAQSVRSRGKKAKEGRAAERSDAFLLKTTIPMLHKDLDRKVDTLVLRMQDFGHRRRTVKSARPPRAAEKPAGTHTKMLRLARSHGKAVRSRKLRNFLVAVCVAAGLAIGGYYGLGYAVQGAQYAQQYIDQHVPWRSWLAGVSGGKPSTSNPKRIEQASVQPKPKPKRPDAAPKTVTKPGTKQRQVMAGHTRKTTKNSPSTTADHQPNKMRKAVAR